MVSGDGESSSVEVVSRFLDTVVREQRRPTLEELQSIRPALEELHAKLLKLRAMGPAFRGVDFSPELWALMRLIGKKAEPVGGDSVFRRIAASFLSL